MKGNTKSYVTKWPLTPYEREQQRVAFEAERMPEDHILILRAIPAGHWTPRVHDMARQAGLSYPITRSCLRNLKHQKMCKIISFTREDGYGYYGCGYILTNLGKDVLRYLKLEPFEGFEQFDDYY